MAKKVDISKITYAGEGVDLIAANKINKMVIERLNALGIDTKGLFGGAIDITGYKHQHSVPIGVMGTPISEGDNSVDTGKKTTWMALKNWLPRDCHALATLDYYASNEMDEKLVDFVEGVARQGLDERVKLIGGESAQMPDHYRPGERDAYVDVIFHGIPTIREHVIDIAKYIKDMKNPCLCGSTDSEGTKPNEMLRLSPLDIMFHGCNDVAAIGVWPLAFKLYVAGNVDDRKLFDVEKWAANACEGYGLAYLGGNVVPNTQVYNEGKVDIAGTVIGVIDKEDLITGEKVKEGDVIIGVSTDCIMTNGLSLARGISAGIQENTGWDLDTKLDDLGGKSQRDEIVKPHTLYTDILFGTYGTPGILKKFEGCVHGTAHITGGGQMGNINRMVPDGLCAVVKKEVLPIPPLMRFYLDHKANEREMYDKLNMGVGMTFTVPANMAEQMVGYINDKFAHLNPHTRREAKIIGKIEKSNVGEKARWAA